MSTDPFEALRPRLFSIAYRMVGRASVAEELVQDTYLRWLRADRAEVRDPEAWLAQVLTRLCLDHLKKASSQREHYVGPWLPEPIADGRPDEAGAAGEMVSMALLRLLDRMGPRERAVFLLKEVFELDHARIAEALGISEGNSRQVLRRAKRHVAEETPRFPVNPDEHARLLAAFFGAAQARDRAAMLQALHPEAVWVSDGGAARTAARRPVRGRESIVRLALGLLTGAAAHLHPEVAEINGLPALLLWDGEQLDSAIGLDAEDGVITGLWTVRNPEKLIFLQRQLTSESRSQDTPPAPGGGSS